jgi:UDP-N-acetylglucosamine 2-epimerase
MLEALEPILQRERPDWVLVYGDTNSTLAGALAASKLRLPIAHVEAGLRSFNRSMPEEINRVLTDHLSALLFCPTARAVKNLSCEGIVRGVHQVGDVMFDSLRYHLARTEHAGELQARLGVHRGDYALATVHRAEATDRPECLSSIVDALGRLGLPVVWPIHPRTETALEQIGLTRLPKTVYAIPPVSYLEMLALQRDARVILTDSGGVQKEAFWLGVPCVTFRRETEWEETVEAGWNCLAGTDPERIVAAVQGFFAERPTQAGIHFGDGHAAERILEVFVRTMAEREA